MGPWRMWAAPPPPGSGACRPWSALAPQRLRPTTPGRFLATPMWFGVLSPPPPCGGGGSFGFVRLLSPATGVMSGPRFVLHLSSEELGCALQED